MLTFLDKLTSYIAPHECLACGHEGSLLCADCLPLLPGLQPQCYRCHRTDKGSKTCRGCRSSSPLHTVQIGTQYEGFAEALVKALKFHRALDAVQTIATSLADNFTAKLPEDAVLVPVPTASSRVRQRGYDQSVLITKALSKKLKLPYSQLLVRHGQYRQTNSSRPQRLTQLQGAFTVRSNNTSRKKEIILIDDVLTTGATLESAATALKQAGAKKINALVFARAE